MSDVSDVLNVGLTPDGEAILDRLGRTEWFPSREAAAKFCLAHAVRAGVSAGDADGASKGWASERFDEDGKIRQLLAALYPDCQTPVRLMRHLVNEGALLLKPRLERTDLTPPDLFR